MSNAVVFTLPVSGDDDRPLPLIVATKWNFPLVHLEVDGQLFYAVQDWLHGITGKQPIYKRWNDMRRANSEITSLTIYKPYVANNNKTYQMAFANQENLLTITRLQNGFRHVTWEKLLQQNPRVNQSEFGYLYVIGLSQIPNYFKIGIAKNLESRIVQIRVDNPFGAYYNFTVQIQDYVKIERELHAIFSSKNVSGEWFLLSEEDLNFIRQYTEKRTHAQV